MERLNSLTFDFEEGACNTFKDSSGISVYKVREFIVRLDNLGSRVRIVHKWSFYFSPFIKIVRTFVLAFKLKTDFDKTFSSGNHNLYGIASVIL